MSATHRLVHFARRLGTVLRPYRGGCALVALLVGVDAGFAALLGVSFGWLVDHALVPRDGTKLAEILGVLVVGIVLVSGTSVAQDYLQARIGGRVAKDLREEIFDRVQRLPLSWHAAMRSGDVLFKFGNNVTAIESTVTTILPTTLRGMLNLAINLVLLFHLQWRLAAIGVALLPLTFVSFRLLGARVASASDAREAEETKAMIEVTEAVTAQPVVKAFGLEERLLGRFAAAAGNVLQATVRASFLGALMNSTSFIAVNVLELAMIAMTCWFAFHGRLSIGEVVAFHALYIQVTRSLLSLAQLKPQVLNATTSMHELETILDEPPPREPPTAKDVRLESIVFDDVRFGYSGDRHDLDGVSFEVPSGRSIAFVGPSGSGKSTLVNLLLRFWEPKSGRITIDGIPIDEVRRASLRSKIGLVMQEPVLFATSVRENIRIGRPDATDEEVEDAAKRAELHDVVMRLPHGYDTKVGERGARMSGGQKQRIAIARALVRRPSLLVLDEATSALDLATESKLVASLERAEAGHTVISITHRLGSVARADRIYVLDAGRIVEQGTHDELLARDGLYARQWRSQHGFVFTHDANEVTITPDRVRQIPLFADLDAETIEKVSKLFTAEHHAEESVVFREGDEADAFYVVVRGEAVAEAVVEDGTTRRFGVMRDGDTFGEIGLLKETNRTATVRTTTPCILLTLKRDPFFEVVRANAALRAKLDAMADERLSRDQSRRQRPPMP